MKLMLFGSTPSAIQATFTPAPEIPSDRAVGLDLMKEAVWVSPRPSGSSCAVFCEHALGSTFGVRAGPLRCLERAALVTLTGAAESGLGPAMVTSGMTSLTAGSRSEEHTSEL